MPEMPSPQQSPAKTKSMPIQTIAFLLGIIAFILALGGIAFGVAIWHRLNSAQLEQSLGRFQGELQQSQAELQAAIATNRKNIDQLTHEVTHPSAEQTVAEIAYLVQLAHLHLTIENNTLAAIQILKMVRQQLQPVSSDALTPLKQAVDQDITALSAVPQIDFIELSERLDHLKTEIAALSMQPHRSAPESPTTSTPESKTWWEKIKHSFSKALNNLFVIRRVDHPTSPLTEPGQTLFLKENLQLQLVQAQWALLNREPKVYQGSLNRAVQWLSNYDHNQPEADNIIKKIQALAVINIKPQTPQLQSWSIVKTLLTQDVGG
ncbi:uroporphyrinogen-III C-methyltransferase [Coxiella burnetii]|uniref:Uroporphyrin-III C-methyltransferase n=1 Tax=Coxiella burnetii (strain RSA 493 / Nine Mile phase I) TaxID=227377 RepID=Q83A31_COXBU|nr:uroporphyrinogen-III C-methyltransferase [Coxiella burnetii]NP_821050.2 uroporphyrin-III C-methyltransferase [Coxiella burnetii RSA 493]AAO91564.2 uroporphyrin-III C-methyltransferase [Coxiella burnetii RSA 493]ARI66821.1 hypothetical protein B7L74_10775 [Coxiella burnetii]MCF2094498.1 uroporphyrinogen-III C-methyltransferase [Coxiella burnetii]MCF2096473.1 uroporphyrinogen-III C-methyltransferase [Coxiella burnetii]MCF2098545.1 uroporphyrinogen-III C-methyltransferase [Coxiella burnetii]